MSLSWISVVWRFTGWFILQRLVWPFHVVMLDGFGHQVVQVLLAEHDEVIQDFLLQCLDELPSVELAESGSS